MSTILKALRRLEQERAKGAERPLREQVVVSRARRRGPWAAWLAASAALVLGFAATWSVLGGIDAPPEPPAAAPTTPATVAAAPPAGLARSAATPAPLRAGAPPPAVAAAPPATAARPAPTPVAGAGPAPEATAPPALSVTPRPAAVAEPMLTPPSVVAAPPASRGIQVVDEPVVTSAITGRASRLVEEETTSPGASAEPPVDVVRTSWHPQAERRTAWVAIGGESPREVKEGEWVGAYEVRSIEPDGVLFADGPLLVHRPVGQR